MSARPSISVLSLLLLLLPCTSLSDWEPIGPEGGEINSITQSLTDPDVLYAASGSYPVIVVRSYDGGQSWSQVGTYNGYNYCMTIGPTGILNAGGAHAVYRSTNGGVTWTTKSLSNVYVYSMVAHPTDPDIVYAAGYQYVSSQWRMAFLRSVNGGSDWTVTPLLSEASYGRCVAVSLSNPDIVWVGGYCTTASPYDPRVFKSTDGGDSFTEVVNSGWNDDYYLYSLAVHPTNPDIVCVGTYYGIFRTTNGGSSWSEVAQYYYYNYDMEFSRLDPNYVYVAGYSQIYRSSNAGQTWTKISSGLSGTGIDNIAASLGQASDAYIGSIAGFFMSENYGSTWTQSNSGLTLGKVIAYGMSPSQPSIIYKCLTDMGVYKTTDAGNTWIDIETPLTCGDFCAMATHLSDPDIVLALEGSG
ncbi:hypothetical protein JW921_07775 [Candidatus Fermentibacterales bacterium]|nr:hypothetical protein [Candidatus Fermentibacterales bacterium]